MPASITVINKPLEFRGRKDRRDHRTVSHNAVAARSTPIARLKVRIREPTLSQRRRAEPTHVQVIRLPIAAVENTMTIIAILTNVGWFVMNDPAVAAASEHPCLRVGILKGSGLPERKRFHGPGIGLFAGHLWARELPGNENQV